MKQTGQIILQSLSIEPTNRASLLHGWCWNLFIDEGRQAFFKELTAKSSWATKLVQNVESKRAFQAQTAELS